MGNINGLIGIFARQPIFDVKKNTYAFELLYRALPEKGNNFPQDQDGTLATIKLIQNSIFLTGIEKVTGGKPAFINFTKESLVEGIPAILDPRHCVVEILEDIEDSAELIDEVALIKEDGFKIALDDFTLSCSKNELINFADILKIDVLNSSMDEVCSIVKRFKNNTNIKFLAEKVESNNIFEKCKAIGFDYFQGFFFAKPEILSCKDIAVSKVNMMNLLRIISKDEIDLKKTASIIERDPGLTYKLLKVVNSALFYSSRKINSILHGLILLGERDVRKWITILALSNLLEDSPDELLVTSCLRAKFCEHVAFDVMPSLRDEAFITGLLSLFDVILCMPFEKILEELPLSNTINQALINKKGPLAYFLELAKNYEIMNVDQISLLTDKMRLEREKLFEYYYESLIWSSYFYNL